MLYLPGISSRTEPGPKLSGFEWVVNHVAFLDASKCAHV